MKYPVLFRICLTLLLFGIASVQALKDTEICKGDNSEDVPCDNDVVENEFHENDLENRKSVFSDNHDCNVLETADGSLEEGSCLKKETGEDEDQSELSMLEQSGKDESQASCEIKKETEDASVKCTKNDGSADAAPDLKEQETAGDDGADLSTTAQVESPTEVEKTDQDPEINVKLREILLKLKPEGLTDNEDEQPAEYSVTEASMGEDGEVEEESLVSSGSAEKQDAGVDNSSDSSKNGSGSSGSGINKKAVCLESNSTDIISNVEIINATLLMKLLQGNPNVTNRSSAGPCHLIYFFSPYCPFSVAGSPYVNAMARSLRNIPVFGLDSIEHHSVNARYGVMGTPTLLLFHNGNGVGRYNASEYSVMQLLAFINHYTDQSITDINVTSSDFRATLPSQIAVGRPYALWASWIFLLSCAAWLFLTSELCAKLTEAVLNNWREAEAQNDQD